MLHRRALHVRKDGQLDTVVTVCVAAATAWGAGGVCGSSHAANHDSVEMFRHSAVAERLAASQEGLRSVKLVS
jgi:hypothetical protein